MTYQEPLRPEEDEYRTTQVSPDVAPSGDPLEPEASAPGSGAPPWIVIGLVLLAIFAAILVYALVLPALG